MGQSIYSSSKLHISYVSVIETHSSILASSLFYHLEMLLFSRKKPLSGRLDNCDVVGVTETAGVIRIRFDSSEGNQPR